MSANCRVYSFTDFSAENRIFKHNRPTTDNTVFSSTMIAMCSLLIAVRCYAGMRCAMSKISRYNLTTARERYFVNKSCISSMPYIYIMIIFLNQVVLGLKVIVNLKVNFAVFM